jgi:predicted small secreted protein
MFAVAILALSVVGCRNTARGVGKDVEKAGEKIQEKTR